MAHIYLNAPYPAKGLEASKWRVLLHVSRILTYYIPRLAVYVLKCQEHYLEDRKCVPWPEMRCGRYI